ncbi:hypothetical protein [Nocardioides bruguierae]|uniref:hypothetical protein n=1 Tax=Nocardioides bruguierae TaxID=2945102 RepID=UPI00202006EF|nr:hypothetical protein [Nocardioides bruguierae]MCL8025348.1 hypothetical protein [Nocardioides bruguierae]
MSAFLPRALHTRAGRLGLARSVWGLAALTVPGRVATVLPGARDDRFTRGIGRVLGARHLAQAVLSGPDPTPSVQAMGVWVDGAHAASTLVPVLTGRPFDAPAHRWAALVDGGIAATWAYVGWRGLPVQTGEPAGGFRADAARVLLRRLPGGVPLLRRAGLG